MSAILARLGDLLAGEPVVVIGVVDAVLILAVHLGLPLDDGTKGAIDALLAAIGLLLARSKVSPA